MPHRPPPSCGVVVSESKEIGIGFQPPLPNNRLVCLDPDLTVSLQLVFDSCDEGDAPMAMGGQVRHCITDAAFVVRDNGRAARAGPSKNDGKPVRYEVIDVPRLHRVGRPRPGCEWDCRDETVGIPRADGYKVEL